MKDRGPRGMKRPPQVAKDAPDDGDVLAYSAASEAYTPSPVASLQGTPVSGTAPAAGNVLAYNGSEWVPDVLPNSFADDVSTTNNTQTTLASTTPEDPSLNVWDGYVLARDTNGTDYAVWSLVIRFHRSGGTVTLIAATGTGTPSHSTAPLAAADVAVSVSGTAVLVRVTGIASSIAWSYSGILHAI
jgi:hypothetical protein